MIERGKRNLITDVPGVTVGHQTIKRGTARTGVTGILPHQGNLFREKLAAAAVVVNGFGKSTGLLQIQELGTIETPILLTNTFGVGSCSNGLIKYMLQDNPEIGETTGTVNPLVLECNDSDINDIRQMAVTEEDAAAALAAAAETFQQGAVGAGVGMSCYDLKGGIGSSSRILHFDREYTLGALVLTNYGNLPNLEVFGEKIGPALAETIQTKADQGSCIVILATDLPLDSRQLGRVARRGGIGLTRTGAFVGNGSGEIVVSFSTAERFPHFGEGTSYSRQIFNENLLDTVFEAAAEVVDEAVLRSMVHAETTEMRNGLFRYNLLTALSEKGDRLSEEVRKSLSQQLSALLDN